jgi:hypothetical protein
MVKLSLMAISSLILGIFIALKAEAYSIDRNSDVSGGEFEFISLTGSYILQMGIYT